MFLISLFSSKICAELNLHDGEFTGSYSLAALASALLETWLGALVFCTALSPIVIGWQIVQGEQHGDARTGRSDSQSLDISQGPPPPL